MGWRHMIIQGDEWLDQWKNSPKFLPEAGFKPSIFRAWNPYTTLLSHNFFNALHYASNTLKNDRNIILNTISKHGNLLEFVSVAKKIIIIV